VFARIGRAGFDAAFALRGGLSSPVLGGLLGGQVFVLLERLLASTVGVGAVSTLSYARGVVFTPSIVSQSIALGLYPGMVRAHEANDVAHIRGSLLRGLRATLFVAVVFAGFFALFAQPTTDLLLRRGAFDPRAAHHVASALAAFSLALVGTMLMVFVARIFYAIAYFRGVVWTQVVALAVYVAIALPLRSVWSTSGLAIAFGIAEVTGGVFGLALAGRKADLAGRVALVEACVPACARAAVVVAALAVVRVAGGRRLVRARPRGRGGPGRRCRGPLAGLVAGARGRQARRTQGDCSLDGARDREQRVAAAECIDGTGGRRERKAPAESPAERGETVDAVARVPARLE